MIVLELALGFGAILGVIEYVERRQRRRVHDQIASSLGATFETSEARRFRRNGYHGVISRAGHRFVEDDYSRASTVIVVELAGRVPLALHVGRRDKALVVEGAPTDIIHALIDPDMHAFLSTFERVVLEVKDELVVTIAPWIVDPATAVAIVARMIALADRIRCAFLAPSAAPYRELVGAQAHTEQLALQHAEVASWKERRIVRLSSRGWVGFALVVAVAIETIAKRC